MAANDYYQTNAQGHLAIGGVDALKLAKEFGTPLVVYDVQKIKQQFQAFQKAFAEESVNYSEHRFLKYHRYQLKKCSHDEFEHRL